MTKALTIVALAFFLNACATTYPQTARVTVSPPPVPTYQKIDGVPFVDREEGHCGPSALAMAIGSAGRDVDFDELSSHVFNPSQKGSLQQDMIGAVRREGLMAIPIDGMNGVVQEVASGTPVIVFQNLGLSFYPHWHYAVVTGYDLAKQELILNSGPQWGVRVPMKRFEHSWELAGYWALVVLPPEQLSVSADEVAHMKAAAGLEQAGQLHAADVAYQTILTRWPQSLAAQVGRANLAYKNQDPREAVRILERALRDHPDSQVLKHNLSVARAAAETNRE